MEHNTPSQTVINERRDFFRIDDEVILRYVPVDKSSALANIIPEQLNDDPNATLLRELQLIEQESSQHLRVIADTNRELEVYLKALNKKIDLIANHVVGRSHSNVEKALKIISLSEGGLAYRCSDEQAHDGYLALQLTLLPSHISLVLFAKVINCSKLPTADSSGFSIALSFVHLKDSDRQIIAKHVMQHQLSKRRKQPDETA